jgi:hypothetical protein
MNGGEVVFPENLSRLVAFPAHVRDRSDLAVCK